MIYIYNSNIKYKKQIEYVFENIFYVLGLKYTFDFIGENNNFNSNDILLVYDDKDFERYTNNFKNIIIINPSNKFFSENYLKKDSIPNGIRRFNTKGKEDIVSIFNDDIDLYIKKNLKEKRVIKTNIDIISDIFFMLTRYEEVVNIEVCGNERFNRFPASQSLAFINNFLDRPIVNEHMDLLWSFIDSFNLGYKRKKWWGNKEFAACLTHDVDMIIKFKSIKNIIKPFFRLILKYKDVKKVFFILTTYFKNKKDYKKDPFWTFDYIMDIEKRYNFKSSFYFMSGGTSKFDNFYNIKDKKVLELMEQIEKDEFEVGYHNSFNSYNDFQMMKKEKYILDEFIKNKPYGCRLHYLRFEVPLTWRHQEKLELLYDATLSYADAEGFRCGTCFPFKPYDLLENRVLDIWEIPLVVMDTSMQDSAYRSYKPKEALEKTEKLIDTVKKHGGVFTMLYHNDSFDPYNKMCDGWKDIYEQTMKYLYDNNCFGTNGREIINVITKH